MTEIVYEFPTSLTLSYRESAWGLERIVLDSISNHLPADSKGTNVAVKLKQNGIYVDLKQADPSKETEEVVFEDDGAGYDVRLLSILFSSKFADALSVGQFGEGLKLVATAALRKGIRLEYNSRNWTAAPFAKKECIDEHGFSRLCFKVIENGNSLKGSKTVFLNPSKELLDEIFELPEKVLALNEDYRELYNEKDCIDGLSYFLSKLGGYNSRIIGLDTEERALFIKGVFVSKIPAIFSYDLGLANIAPDRMFADTDKVLNRVESLLKGCANPEVIAAVLKEAHDNPQKLYYEFMAFENRKVGDILDRKKNYNEFEPSFKIEIKDKYGLKGEKENLWASVFKMIYGEKAVIASNDTDINKDAEIMGYKPIKLNGGIADYLKKAGIENADEFVQEKEYRWVSNNELTQDELSVLKRANRINEAIGFKDTPETRIYSGLFLKSGREVETSKGVYINKRDGTKFIGIKRSVLKDRNDFDVTYIEELGHHISQAPDYSRAFADYFIQVVADLIRPKIEEE